MSTEWEWMVVLPVMNNMVHLMPHFSVMKLNGYARGVIKTLLINVS